MRVLHTDDIVVFAPSDKRDGSFDYYVLSPERNLESFFPSLLHLNARDFEPSVSPEASNAAMDDAIAHAREVRVPGIFEHAEVWYPDPEERKSIQGLMATYMGLLDQEQPGPQSDIEPGENNDPIAGTRGEILQRLETAGRTVSHADITGIERAVDRLPEHYRIVLEAINPEIYVGDMELLTKEPPQATASYPLYIGIDEALLAHEPDEPPGPTPLDFRLTEEVAHFLSYHLDHFHRNRDWGNTVMEIQGNSAAYDDFKKLMDETRLSAATAAQLEAEVPTVEIKAYPSDAMAKALDSSGSPEDAFAVLSDEFLVECALADHLTYQEFEESHKDEVLQLQLGNAMYGQYKEFDRQVKEEALLITAREHGGVEALKLAGRIECDDHTLRNVSGILKDERLTGESEILNRGGGCRRLIGRVIQSLGVGEGYQR